MQLEVSRKQFDFEELKNGLLVVTFNPFSSKFNKKRYFTLFEQHTKWYNLAFACKKDNPDWVYLSYLADFVINHHGQIIEAI